MKFKKKKLNEQLLLGFSSKGSLFIFSVMHMVYSMYQIHFNLHLYFVLLKYILHQCEWNDKW